MDPNLDMPGADAAYPDSNPPTVAPATIDVPSTLAGHIGDLYAEEEIRQRHERTELMIRRAEAHGDA